MQKEEIWQIDDTRFDNEATFRCDNAGINAPLLEHLSFTQLLEQNSQLQGDWESPPKSCLHEAIASITQTVSLADDNAVLPSTVDSAKFTSISTPNIPSKNLSLKTSPVSPAPQKTPNNSTPDDTMPCMQSSVLPTSTIFAIQPQQSMESNNHPVSEPTNKSTKIGASVVKSKYPALNWGGSRENEEKEEDAKPNDLRTLMRAESPAVLPSDVGSIDHAAPAVFRPYSARAQSGRVCSPGASIEVAKPSPHIVTDELAHDKANFGTDSELVDISRHTTVCARVGTRNATDMTTEQSHEAISKPAPSPEITSNEAQHVDDLLASMNKTPRNGKSSLPCY